MGKRKRKRQRQQKRRADLPLFDLPLNPDGSEPAPLDGPADLEIGTAEPSVTPGDEKQAPQEPPAVSRAASIAARESAEERVDREQLDLVDIDGVQADVSDQEAVGGETRGDESSAIAWGDRVLSGLADLAAQLAVVGLAVVASYWQGVTVGFGDWLPFALLALVFSFLYWMVPLAFWGRTPGMVWVGHRARAARGGGPLAFGQAFLRWLGAVVTVVLAGLPLLLALQGRSLSDRMSDSETLSER